MEKNNAAPMAPAPVATPAPAPAPAPAAPAAPAPVVAPQVIHQFPTIDSSGKQVNPLGQQVPSQDHIDFDEVLAPAKKSSKSPAPPSAPDSRADAPGAPKAQAGAEAPSAPEEPDAPASPFALEAPSVMGSEQSGSKGRDYSEFPAELQPMIKKLPNALFNHIKSTMQRFNSDVAERDAKIAALTKEKDEASGRLVSDHPEAFAIDPDYRNVVSAYGRTQFESEHYTNQLALIDQGEAWSIIEGYDNAGNPVYKEIPASENGTVDYRAKAGITQALQKLAAKQNEYQQQANSIRAHYQNAATEVLNHYKEARARLFPSLDPEKLTDVDEKKVYEYALNALPRVERNRPSAQMLGLAAVVVRRQAGLLRAALERAERAERLVKNSNAAAPVKVAPTASTPTAAADEHIDFDELERTMSR